MTYRLSKRAGRQLRHIHEFIRKDNQLAADEILEKLAATFQKLAAYPKLGPQGRRSGTREFVQAPFVIVYRVNRDRLDISAVLHGSQQYD